MGKVEEGELLFLTFLQGVENNQSMTKVKIACDQLELAADIIQDLSKYFQWEELESEAEFPNDFAQFQEVGKPFLSLFCRPIILIIL